MKWDLGCYGDGTFGHQHTRERCAEIVTSGAGPLKICRALQGPMSDDAQEEYDACDWLNETCAVYGAVWSWQDGDFGLWPIDDES